MSRSQATPVARRSRPPAIRPRVTKPPATPVEGSEAVTLRDCRQAMRIFAVAVEYVFFGRQLATN